MNINNLNILLIAFGAAALSSCSTAYQTGQTPDDVYYSAPKQVQGAVAGRSGDDEDGEYLAVNNKRNKYSADRNQYENVDDYDTYRNDRWLRMSVGNPYYMSTFNNYYWNDWGYSGIYGGYNHGFGNYYNSGFGLSAGFGYGSAWNDPFGGPLYWNSFYNPYAFNYNPYGHYYGGIIPNIKPPVYRTNTARPTVFNPRAYSNNAARSNVNGAGTRSYYNPRTGSYSNYNNTNTGSSRINNTNTRRNNSAGTYYNTNNNTRQGNNTTRQNNTYTPSSNSGSRPERTYTPSAPSYPSPSGGGSGSGGGGGARRPTRN